MKPAFPASNGHVDQLEFSPISKPSTKEIS